MWERERETDRKSKSKTARDVAEVAEGEDRKYVGSSFVAWILGWWQDIQRMNSKWQLENIQDKRENNEIF